MSCETAVSSSGEFGASSDQPPVHNNNTGNSIHKSVTYKIPWVEKYRPRILDDVLGNDETIVRLRAIAKDGNMPNLILCGPPGTVRSEIKIFRNTQSSLLLKNSYSVIIRVKQPVFTLWHMNFLGRHTKMQFLN
jgi:hypothetical protein